MTFLKRFGLIASQVAKIVVGIGPLIPQTSSTQDKVVDTMEQIANIILTTEALTATLGTPGPDKLRASTPLIAQILMTSDLFYTRKISDPALFKQGAESIAEGMVKVLNSLSDKDLETKDIPK